MSTYGLSSSSDHNQSNVDFNKRTTAPPDEEREIALLRKGEGIPQREISRPASSDSYLNSFDAGGGDVDSGHRYPPTSSSQSPPHRVERSHSTSSRHIYDPSGISWPHIITPMVTVALPSAPSTSSSSAPQVTLQNLPFYPASPSYPTVHWTNDSTASKLSDWHAQPYRSPSQTFPAFSVFKRRRTLRRRPSHGGVIQQEDFSSNMDSKTTVSIFTSALAISLLGYAHVKFSGHTNPKRSDDWITSLWTLSAVLSLGCTVLFGMTGVGYMWSLRAQAEWLDFSEHTRMTLNKWENSDWHWTWMFWYCIILDVMFILAPLSLLFGIVVFVWAEEKRQLAVAVSVVVVIVAIQWVFRFFMLFTCLWRFEYKVATPWPYPGRTAWPGQGHAGGMA